MSATTGSTNAPAHRVSAVCTGENSDKDRERGWGRGCDRGTTRKRCQCQQRKVLEDSERTRDDGGYQHVPESCHSSQHSHGKDTAISTEEYLDTRQSTKAAAVSTVFRAHVRLSGVLHVLQSNQVPIQPCPNKQMCFLNVADGHLNIAAQFSNTTEHSLPQAPTARSPATRGGLRPFLTLADSRAPSVLSIEPCSRNARSLDKLSLVSLLRDRKLESRIGSQDGTVASVIGLLVWPWGAWGGSLNGDRVC